MRFVIFQKTLIQIDANEENTETEEAVDNRNVREILQAIGCGDVVPVNVKRLGARNREEGGRSRPLLVVTDSGDTKRKVLKRKMNLKENEDERFKSVYIKQDEPIAVQKEWKRLRDAMKKEKTAPTNIGTNIRIDYKKRVLLRDDVVIDTFKSPFPKRGPSHSQ